MSGDQGMGKYIEQFKVVLGLRDQGRLAEAVGLCRKYVDSKPPIGEGWNLVASAAQQMGDLSTAIKAARLYVADDEQEPARKLFLAGILGESPNGAEAASLANKNIGSYENVADLNFLTGLLNARSGQFDAADTYLRMAIDCDPGHGRSWEYLVNISGTSTDSEDFAAMERQVKEDRYPSPEDKLALLYALGKACHDSGRYEDAWKYFSEGARQITEAKPIDLRALESYVARLKIQFSREFVTSFHGTGSVSTRPIFIVGMPRSGTSLVERLLGSLENVQPGGEMTLIRLATLPIKNMEPGEMAVFFAEVGKVSGGLMDPWKNLADNYLALLNEYFGSGGRVTDKQLGSQLFMGAIKLMFPNAKVLYVRRHPIDTAFSCFRVRFSQGNHWSYSFENIAHYTRMYEDIMSHWMKLFPESIMEVQYESLVDDPKRQTERILDHCELLGEVDTDKFYLHDSRVATASMAEVRKPIYTTSLGAWKNYKKWLEPYQPLFESIG